jgi:uncharacterized protein YndB with AHSA1/START domain
MMETAQVTLPTDSTVRVARDFRASRELVYRAYTEPALVQRWLLGPPGWTMPLCEMDVRVGGGYRWQWRNIANGKQFGFHGEFREVVPRSKLVHTELFDPGDVGGNMGDGALVTLELTQSGAITTVVTTIDYYTKHSRDAAVATGMTDGMEAGYARLDGLLPELR